MYYIDRDSERKSGEFALCNTGNSKMVYFDVDPNYYGKGEPGIINSLKKQFPIPRKEVLEKVEETYFQPWWKKYTKSAEAHALGCFRDGAVDSVFDWEGHVVLSR